MKKQTERGKYVRILLSLPKLYPLSHVNFGTDANLKSSNTTNLF